MRRLLLLTTAALFATSAAAADLKAQPSRPTAPAAVDLWTGFYVGAHAGYGFGQAKTDFPGFEGSDAAGFLAGGQFGYNWHPSRFWVVGVVVDGTWLGNVKSDDVNGRGEYMGTVRGRIGFLPMENLLLYGTAGLALAKTSQSAPFDPQGQLPFQYNDVKFGYTAGAGVEIALNRNWSVFGEYLYADFGKSSFIDLIPYETTLHVVRGGVNFKF